MAELQPAVIASEAIMTSRLERDPLLRPVRGMFVAQEIKPQAKVLAADRGIDCLEVDYDELQGRVSDALRLF